MQNKTSIIGGDAIFTKTSTKPLHLFGAFLLGIVILYGVGFAHIPVAHNAAHDVRHAQGFPCH